MPRNTFYFFENKVALLILVSSTLILACQNHAPKKLDSGPTNLQAWRLPKPAVIAHRGLSYWLPEETCPAFEAAILLGADFIEMDLQKSQDGVLLAFHDDTTIRTSNIEQIFPEKKSKTLNELNWKELSSLDVGSWFNKKFPERSRPEFVGLKICSLLEVLEMLKKYELLGRTLPGLYLESKEAARFPGYENDIISLLSKFGWTGQSPQKKVILQSFDTQSLLSFKQLAPLIPRVRLFDDEEFEKSGFEFQIRTAAEYAQGAGLSQNYVSLGFIRFIHEQGLIVHPYTLNNYFQLFWADMYGVDGYFTDRADLALERLGRSSQTLEWIFKELTASPPGKFGPTHRQ